MKRPLDTLTPPGRVAPHTATFRVECEQTQAQLELRGIALEETNPSAHPDHRREPEAPTGDKSAPQPAIDGPPSGGFAELTALDRAGGLSNGDEPRPKRSRKRESVNAPIESSSRPRTVEHAIMRMR